MYNLIRHRNFLIETIGTASSRNLQLQFVILLIVTIFLSVAIGAIKFKAISVTVSQKQAVAIWSSIFSCCIAIASCHNLSHLQIARKQSQIVSSRNLQSYLLLQFFNWKLQANSHNCKQSQFIILLIFLFIAISAMKIQGNFSSRNLS